MAFGIKSFQEKQRRWPFFGHWPAWFGIEHPVEGIHLTERRQSQPPAGDRFPAPTGDQILQEWGWRPCCVNDEYCTALTGRGLKREGSSSELRGADELSPDPGLRPHLQFQGLGPLLMFGRSVSSLSSRSTIKTLFFLPKSGALCSAISSSNFLCGLSGIPSPLWKSSYSPGNAHANPT